MVWDGGTARLAVLHETKRWSDANHNGIANHNRMQYTLLVEVVLLLQHSTMAGITYLPLLSY